MKKKPAVKWRMLMLLAGMILGSSGVFSACALFSSYEDAPQKNTNIRFDEPQFPYRKIDESTADRIWQSSKTGNTIAINSACGKDDASMKAMEDGLLSGVENLKSQKTIRIKIDGTDADRIHAEGETDHVLVDIDLVVLKKSKCNYDLAYVARHKTFEEEVAFFNDFLDGFHAP